MIFTEPQLHKKISHTTNGKRPNVDSVAKNFAEIFSTFFLNFLDENSEWSKMGKYITDEEPPEFDKFYQI